MLNLGEFIQTLEGFDPAAPIQMRGRSGLGFISWRGVYAEPSLDHGATTMATSTSVHSIGNYQYRDADGFDSRPPCETVGELLAVARDVAAGGMLGGYKGDWFAMARYSPLHADPCGQCPGSEVIGVALADGVVTVQVHERTYEDASR